MKTFILAASLLALTSSAMAGDVGVSVNIGQPGFYGHIDIGDFPQPRVIYQQPVLIERPRNYIEQAPIYLRVPPGHAKHWAKHCGDYNACGRNVLFVDDRWYTNEYAPRYREMHAQRHEHERNEGNDRHDRDERHDHNDDRGEREHDHGRGHDKN